MKHILPLLFLLFSTWTSNAQVVDAPAGKNTVDCSIAEIDSLVELFYTNRAYEKILPYALVGVEKAVKQYGKQDTVYAKMLYYVGLGYQMNKNLGNAEKYLKQAIAIQKVKIPQSSNYANSLYVLATVYKGLGNYVSAEPLYKESLKIRKLAVGEKHLDYSKSLNNLANFYMDISRYELSEPLLKESLKIKKEVQGEKHPDYALSLNNLGILYWYMGNYALAEPLYKEAMSIRKEVLGETNPAYAKSLNNLAVLYMDMKNYALAEPLSKEALRLKKEVLGEKNLDYANSLNNLAILYKDMRNYPQSESLHKNALKIRKELLGEKHPDYASSLHNLADLYKDMGNYASAEPLYKEFMQIYKEVFGEKHPEYIGCLNNLAFLYHKTNRNALFWDYTQQAIAANSGLEISTYISKPWADSLVSADYSSIKEMILTLKSTYNLLNADSTERSDVNLQTLLGTKQIIVADLALRLLKKNRDNFSEEADKLRTLSQTSDWVLCGLAVLSKTADLLHEDKNTLAEKAFALAEQSKAVLVLNAAQTAMAQSFGDLPDSLGQKEQQLQKQKVKYEAGIAEKRPNAERDSLRNLLNKLNVEINDFKTSVEKSFPKYATLKYQHKDVEVKEVQKLLDDKTALVEYVIGDSVVYVFYVDKKQVRMIPMYLSNKVLNEKIKTLHSTLSDYKLAANETAVSYQRYTENAYWFYQNLVHPALPPSELGTGKHAKAIQKLIIVSDGELGHLPFEAFLTKLAPQKETNYAELNYLSNDYQISYNYSATIWKANKEAVKNTNNGQIMALASNYDIKTIIDYRLPVYQRLRVSLEPLPSARKEIETLSESFNGFFGMDKEASEKVFKEKAGDYAVIHLAMHGLLDVQNPILSSLAFTEDGDSVENNFLQAYEISKMKLNADLVVLSACETGYGRFDKGNGIASLAQAFAYAGAPAMIISLWQVNDYATSEIMKNLYNNLANGMGKDEALQQAKIKYMKEAEGVWAHPAFWSPFILMGNTDAVTLGRTQVFALTWIIGISLVLLGGIAFAIRRKKE